MKKIVIILMFLGFIVSAQEKSGFQIARLKYNGGGDWYNDPSAEVNLLNYINENTNIEVYPEYTFVDIASNDLYSYPFLFITGHGNFVLSDTEAQKLRVYCERGGFIYIDDDYGMDNSARKVIKKIFPEKDLVELPFNHPIYNLVYKFPQGPPKTHEHDNKPPQGFSVFLDGRMVLYYTYESNPSDGWTDQKVHNDSTDKREEALKFGANIIVYALTH
ncbi:MAG: hypothetical protein CVV23_07515 [Ignavibacteriae bacterium HGW-Ignavibacteriae-2]|jgi:hypothetical protein|nr:MAG: hypothetical protein CVV23_07515 [Ignavibacteriae bacterium HGW-Ignavibacteriae-2]